MARRDQVRILVLVVLSTCSAARLRRLHPCCRPPPQHPPRCLLRPQTAADPADPRVDDGHAVLRRGRAAARSLPIPCDQRIVALALLRGTGENRPHGRLRQWEGQRHDSFPDRPERAAQGGFPQWLVPRHMVVDRSGSGCGPDARPKLSVRRADDVFGCGSWPNSKDRTRSAHRRRGRPSTSLPPRGLSTQPTLIMPTPSITLSSGYRPPSRGAAPSKKSAPPPPPPPPRAFSITAPPLWLPASPPRAINVRDKLQSTPKRRRNAPGERQRAERASRLSGALDYVRARCTTASSRRGRRSRA